MYRYDWDQTETDVIITLTGQNLVSFHLAIVSAHYPF